MEPAHLISGVLMGNSIGSVGGCSAAMQGAAATKMSKADLSKMVDQAFSKIDSKGQGFIDKAELETALGQVPGASGSDTSADADSIIKALDTDSDGKVTKDEMSSGLQKLADELDSQFSNMRMQRSQGAEGPKGGGHGGVHRPHGAGGPPPGDGAGKTKDELTAMASDAADSDSALSTDLTKLVSSFDEADTDGDGKVSFREAQALRESQQTSAGASGSEGASAHSSHHEKAEVMGRIMRLMASYGAGDAQQGTTVTATA